MSEKNFKRCLSQHPTYGDIIQSFDSVSNQTGILKITIGLDVFLYITHNKETLPDQPSIDQSFRTRVEETTTIFQRSLRRHGKCLVVVHVDEGQARNKRNSHEHLQNSTCVCAPGGHRDSKIPSSGLFHRD
jgi:hypothetical protein